MFDRSDYLATLAGASVDKEAAPGSRQLRSILSKFRERLGKLGAPRAVVIALLFVCAGVGAFFLLDSPDPKPSSIEDLGITRRQVGGPSGAQSKKNESPELSESDSLAVYVTGAVNAPGVYYLGQGRRVVDAVEAAGGATSDADLARVNLAALLEDGARIYIPKVGENPPPDSIAEGDPAVSDSMGDSSGQQSAAGISKKVNINKAPPAELERLPGIGESLARRIVEDRSRNGPFRALQDLSRVPGIGDVKIAQLAPFVTF